jgi:3-oxoacyl-[acyl-carrier-protein] synthase-3
MNFKFNDKKISGILVVLPENEVKFDDDLDNYNFSHAKSLKLKMTMGYDSRRVVKGDACVSDLCIYGLNYLFENKMIQKDEIDALILVTQSPDYIMPPTSNVIQGILGLKNDMICMDINQGCAGFIVGLFQAFMLLEQDQIRKVVLLNADVLSRKVSKRDRNSNPLIGDAASVTIVERSADTNSIFGSLKMNGAGYDALIIPAGGFRTPSSPETGIMRKDSAGNFRSLDNLVMKGDEVFNFVQSEVPPMIIDLLNLAKAQVCDIDYYMFHQPNRFMLNKLADKIGVAREKMPSNIVEKFGNASGVSIPTAISFNIGDSLNTGSYFLCMAGFGVGLTWASLLMHVDNTEFNKIIYY